jgi:16S rRNA (uracil1498-N3)-methyltransferase
MIAVLVPPGSLVAGQTVDLEDEEVHHLRVRRVEGGEPVRVLDGQGGWGTGVLSLTRRGAAVEVLSAEPTPRPLRLRLGVGAGDRQRFAWLVEKAAELGVTEIFPLEVERTAGVASKLRGPQLERLRRRAREATKQCLAPWAPEVHPPEGLASFLERDLAGERWVGDRSAGPPPSAVAGPVTVVLGPEGGFSEAELSLIRRAGYTPISLGPHSLRFETAALAAAAVVATSRQRGAHG